MGRANYYEPGAHNIWCDRTGYKVKSTQSREEWNGLVVDDRVWEERHPLDFLRAMPDDQSVENPRPGPASDSFLGLNAADTAITGTNPGTYTATPTADGGNTGDGTIDNAVADLSADTSGSYTLKVTRVTRDAADSQDPGDDGEFILTNPSGETVGYGAVGVKFEGGGLSFTLNEDGSTDFVVGDKFTIAVA